uniref:protein FAM236D n=1 Tax=Ictidomys tridecemlineatus TaxID=43179 RepID=UPI001A9F3D85|nr:protein FAM236D [Ictidomys tridecemlineatus]
MLRKWRRRSSLRRGAWGAGGRGFPRNSWTSKSINDPDEEPVAFVVLIDIMQNQFEDSGIPSQTAAPREPWKSPFRRIMDCFVRCFGRNSMS